MSKTTTIFPIVAALKKALEFNSAKSEFYPTNDQQKLFLNEFFNAGLIGLPLFSDKELQAIASNDADVINKFLKERGFDISLPAFEHPEEFGTASVMTVMVEWLLKGQKIKIKLGDGQTYPGISLDHDVYNITKSKHHMHPIVEVNCKNGDKVYMTIADQEYSTWDLLNRVILLSNNRNPSYGYGGFYFPMVELDQQVDISFFKEMNFLGNKAVMKITEAKQQTKFKMNELGAKVESAVAFSGAACAAFAPTPPVIIDKPFFVWMVRSGMTLPYFAGYITQEDWKDTRPAEASDKDVRVVDSSLAVANRQGITYSVRLVSHGSNRVQVIKAIRETLNVSLSIVRDIMADPMGIVAEGLYLGESQELKNKLTNAGASVEILEE